MSPFGLCPPTTQITDYAYPETHPLRFNNYPSSSHDSYLSEEYDTFADEGYDDQGYDDGGYGDSQLHTYSSDEINRRAVALFDFEPENDNEVALREGQVIWISYRHGQGWLVAEDPDSGENGLVPEEYVEILYTDDSDDVPKPFMPRILQEFNEHDGESQWEDTDDEEDVELAQGSSAEKSPTLETDNTLSMLEKKMENSKLE